MALRTSIREFSLANPLYSGATITFYTVDGAGAKTTTKATLYDSATGTGTLTNPQTLDSDGKLAAPVYLEAAVIATVSGLTAPDHDTGIIHTPGSWRGDWATATVYYAGEYVRAGSNADSTVDIYVVEETHTSGTFATDVSGGQLAVAVDVANILFDAAAGIRWDFDTSTSMADPGSGDIRLNNATLSSVTAIAVSANSAAIGTPDVSDFVAIWDDSTNTVKGILIIREIGTPANFAIFTLSAVTDNTTWLQVTVAYVTSSGSFAAADKLAIDFYRAGDVGSLANIVEDLSPQLGAFLDTNSQFISLSQGANIASVAGDTDIWANFDGNAVHITGTNAITDFGTPKQAGDIMFVIFDAAASVVDSATITVDGNANFQAAANDMGIVYALTTSTFLFKQLPNIGLATLGANTFGGEQNLADNLLTRPVLKDYGETVNDIGSTGGGTQDIDLELGNVVSATVDTSANTLTFSNWPATGKHGSVTLEIFQGGSQIFNWPAVMKWAGGTPPTLTDNTAAFTTDYLTDDKLDVTAHGFMNGDIVQVTTSAADLPAGLAINTRYYVVNKTANDFEVSLTEGGAAVNITDNGTGTHTVHSGKDTVVVGTRNAGLTLDGYVAGGDQK